MLFKRLDVDLQFSFEFSFEFQSRALNESDLRNAVPSEHQTLFASFKENCPPHLPLEVRARCPSPCICARGFCEVVHILLGVFLSELARGLREVCEKADDDLCADGCPEISRETDRGLGFAASERRPFRRTRGCIVEQQDGSGQPANCTSPAPPRSFPLPSPNLPNTPFLSCAPRFFLLPPCLVLFGGNL